MLALAIATALALLALAAGPALADPVVAAAGDIACGSATTDGMCQQAATAGVVGTIAPDAVVTLGDDQYEAGSLSDFNSYYGPTWGQWKAITRPSAGNHEYYTAGAAGYFDYFDGQGNATGPAGDRSRGWYSWDLGSWHVVALNSNCAAIGGCGTGSPQEQWLRADLAAHPASCTLAYMHHPRWSSDSVVGSTAEVAPLVQALYDGHADLLLAGHAHTYERFAPQTPAGSYDPAGGVAEIIAGTGGRSEFAFNSIALPNSMVRAQTLGALKLTLHASSYDWQFVPAAGQTFTDSGSAVCHGRVAPAPPPPPPPAPTAPAATTGAATSVTRNSAKLGGSVNPNGQPTSYRFEYGTTSTYGRSTATASAGSGSRAVTVTQALSGLAKGTTYHFRIVASWASGATSRGADATFTTPRH